MRIAITGEKGFIATNLAKEIEDQGHEFVSLDNSSFANENMIYTESGEVCVYSNSVEQWTNLFESTKLDCIVHNAAVVGTDVVALNPDHSIMTNVLGTQRITNAANNTKILNVYIGTTVIYDTLKYQEEPIKESSDIHPRTLYATQKYAGEMFVRNSSDNWLVMRPLFAYGGEGDMNSLIAKTMFALKNNVKELDMFLDPQKTKDYMHVSDFCKAIMIAIKSNVRNQHFNITANQPYNTQGIVDMIHRITGLNPNKIIKWYPETDYLGNHILTENKFDYFFDCRRKISLVEGIKMSWESIISAEENYNPLKYLEQAKKENKDLLKYFPKIES
jgi:nucleoside-diphosphate-sugar epimerase